MLEWSGNAAQSALNWVQPRTKSMLKSLVIYFVNLFTEPLIKNLRLLKQNGYEKILKTDMILFIFQTISNIHVIIIFIMSEEQTTSCVLSGCSGSAYCVWFLVSFQNFHLHFTYSLSIHTGCLLTPSRQGALSATLATNKS